MKFLFVVGGSYKGFYINQLPKISKLDLLVFHQNIFYDFDYEQECLDDAPVTNELIALNQKLNCPIVVYGRSSLLSKTEKCFIVCVNGRVSVINSHQDIYLYIKGKTILIGNRVYKNTKAFSTISIVESAQNYQIISKKYCNNYFICDKKGVLRLQGGKIYRKFRKCCYFSLSFFSKMI